ncbi:hypothetical protein J2Z79_001822 [Symbiobacterium terraclitae]|uniref:Peptidase n=1 Tax=Symbiobacterium terraclitae TaxID=557451 RepID=A0ABS4JTX5_9FIRM|nr:hypothetical protein [Symbiobacterium terraclitae]MBP2018411.1 hypothetical protein [Symbiobacterium terraclitae]
MALRRILLVLLVLLTSASPCLGDTVPMAAVGPHVEPLDSTTVRLAEERIEIHLRRDLSRYPYFRREAVGEYRIWFRFEPEADEAMTVGFPLLIYDPDQHIYGEHIQNLRVAVDGREVATEVRQSPPEAYYPYTDQPQWAVFPVTFRAGEPLEMVVSYTMPVSPWGKGREIGSPFWVSYVLRTGAYWAGTIGRAEAVLTMDRPIQEGDVRVQEHRGRVTTPGWTLEDGALRWVWEDVEPSFDLHAVIENPYWRDTALEVRATLDAGTYDRDELMAATWDIAMLLEAGEVGSPPLHGGVAPVEAAAALVPAMLGAVESYLAEHPGGSYLSTWRPWLHYALEGYRWSPGAQEAITSFLAAVMPESFGSESEAREWVAANIGGALAPGQVDRLVALAVGRVLPTEAAPAAPAAQARPAPPGSQASPAHAAAVDTATPDPGAAEDAVGPGMDSADAGRDGRAGLIGSAGEFVLLVCAVAAVAGVRRRGTCRARG